VIVVKDIDKYRGCLIGGAVGDALGYAVEFLDHKSIFQKYGESGITEYSLVNGVAEISDDTQMTLFTANGLLLGTTRGMTRGIMGKYSDYISLCYKDWYKTQFNGIAKDEFTYSWLINIPELHASRAPGNTCLSAIEEGANGTMEKPINDSKGCGGVMRVAPIGLYFDEKQYSLKEVDLIGSEAAAITHGHELGYIPAAALVHIIQLLAHDTDITLLAAVQESMAAMKECFPAAKHLDELLNLMKRAIDLSSEDKDDVDAIRELGEGWVAEETLAIAIYCSLKYSNSFDKAIIASVNHSGDSDSTGAVTGNIMGAYVGLGGIPEKYIEHLELKDIILEMADDLYNDCKITEYGSYRDDIWEHKYIYHDYSGKMEDKDE
jgi:ADP-ribosylglycohydrolase